jgi:3-deoxy-D-manno-octulosonic-acid transferase
LNLIAYIFFLFLYRLGIAITSIWSTKSKLWLTGRKNFPKIDSTEKKIWVHCASLGEFEQARPIIESLKKEYPQVPLILSFFSPSGYEIRKEYGYADQVIYLPMDGKRNAARLIQKINPMLVVWVKYEYWYHYLKTLHQKQIPTLLVSSIFRENQPFFKWYGGFWREQLRFFSALFVQDSASKDLLQSIGVDDHVFVNGDTRFDRVNQLIQASVNGSSAFEFMDCNQKIIVAGSTWKEDENMLHQFHQKYTDYKLIIVPHEIGDKHIDEILTLFRGSKRYSDFTKNKISNPEEVNVWIVDQMGLLSTLYSISTITYVGGGFNRSGIHNILEAAVWSKPVFFGPNHQKFREARELIRIGGGFSVANEEMWSKILSEWKKHPEKINEAGRNSGEYVKKNTGATERIIDYIYKNRLLTNASN